MTLCGRVTALLNGDGASITFILDDGTGTIEGMTFINDESEARVRTGRGGGCG